MKSITCKANIDIVTSPSSKRDRNDAAVVTRIKFTEFNYSEIKASQRIIELHSLN